MATAETFERVFWRKIGYREDDSLFYEMKASLTTGVQVRFMTFLQAILTVVVGEDIVNWSSEKGILDDLLVDKELDDLQRFSNSEPRSISFEKVTNILLLAKEKTALSKRMSEDGQKRPKGHSVLLSFLRRIENNLSKLNSTKPKLDETLLICEDIKLSIQVVKILLHHIEKTANEEEQERTENYYRKLSLQNHNIPFPYFLQRSLLFHAVLADMEISCEKIETIPKTEGVPQYNAEQLTVIETLIPRLNIMVVSEIIASFNLTTSQLLSAIYATDMFGGKFQVSAECARCHRNWVSHHLKIGDGNHAQFINDAKCIVEEFLKPLLKGTQTNDSEKKGATGKECGLSIVFPGLDEYFKLVSANLLKSCDELEEMKEKNEKLEKENRQLKQENRELSEKRENTNQPLITSRQKLARANRPATDSIRQTEPIPAAQLPTKGSETSREKELLQPNKPVKTYAAVTKGGSKSGDSLQFAGRQSGIWDATQQLNPLEPKLAKSNQWVADSTRQVEQLQADQLPTKASRIDTEEKLLQPASVPSTNKPAKSYADITKGDSKRGNSQQFACRQSGIWDATQQLNTLEPKLAKSNQWVTKSSRQVKQLRADQLPAELSRTNTEEKLSQTASVPSSSKPAKTKAAVTKGGSKRGGSKR